MIADDAAAADMRLAALLGFLAIMAIAIIAAVVKHENKRKSDLGSYRPTHDNRHPNRDEFRVMKDAK